MIMSWVEWVCNGHIGEDYAAYRLQSLLSERSREHLRRMELVNQDVSLDTLSPDDRAWFEVNFPDRCVECGERCNLNGESICWECLYKESGECGG